MASYWRRTVSVFGSLSKGIHLVLNIFELSSLCLENEKAIDEEFDLSEVSRMDAVYY